MPTRCLVAVAWFAAHPVLGVSVLGVSVPVGRPLPTPVFGVTAVGFSAYPVFGVIVVGSRCLLSRSWRSVYPALLSSS